MKFSALKALWVYNGAATLLAVILAGIVGVRNGVGVSAPPTAIVASQPGPRTFNLTPEEFQDAFNKSAAREENGQHNDGIANCAPVGVDIIDCSMKDDGFVEASKAFAAMGARYPDRQKTLDEHIVLFTSGGQLRRVEVRGNHEVGHALHMTGTVADAATAVGADLTDRQATFAFMKAIGLVDEPPPLGQQVSVHRFWGEITCALMSENAAFTCAFTPPYIRIQLAPIVARPMDPSKAIGSATLSDLADGTGASWRRADDDTRAMYAAIGIALIDAQRNVGMDEAGQQAVAVWLKQCMDHEAPLNPNIRLTEVLNACMQSMTPQDAAAIAMAQGAAKRGD